MPGTGPPYTAGEQETRTPALPELTFQLGGQDTRRISKNNLACQVMLSAREKTKAGKRDWRKSEEVTFEQRAEGSEGRNHLEIWEKSSRAGQRAQH